MRNNYFRNLFNPARPKVADGSRKYKRSNSYRSNFRASALPATTCLFLALVSPCLRTPLLAQTSAPASERADPKGAGVRQSIASSRTSSLKYVIAADDVLEVYVVDVPQFSRDYRVGPDGTISLPLLQSPVMAAGLTLSQLSAEISGKLRVTELVSHPHVVVTVRSSRAHTIAVSGAVRNPRTYPVFGPTSMLDVLSQAGGLAPDAGSMAIITRYGTAGTPSRLTGDPSSTPAKGTIKVDLQRLLATGDPSLNAAIFPGDKVTIPRAGVVYVVGAVVRPGGFPLIDGRDKMTVLQAVALGEGLKSTALQKKAVIIRRGQLFPDGRGEIPVNLKNILSGHASDPGLEANDILFIPDSTSRRALRRGAEAAVQIATGIVIWGRY